MATKTNIEYTEYRRLFDSTNLSAVWYNQNEQYLVVQFVGREDTYGYQDVPLYVWEEFRKTIDTPNESAGRYYSANIKGIYKSFQPHGWFKQVGTKTTRPAEVVTESNSLSPADREFVIRGVVEVEFRVKAQSLDEAVAAFQEEYAGDSAKVTEATVKF